MLGGQTADNVRRRATLLPFAPTKSLTANQQTGQDQFFFPCLPVLVSLTARPFLPGAPWMRLGSDSTFSDLLPWAPPPDWLQACSWAAPVASREGRDLQNFHLDFLFSCRPVSQLCELANEAVSRPNPTPAPTTTPGGHRPTRETPSPLASCQLAGVCRQSFSPSWHRSSLSLWAIEPPGFPLTCQRRPHWLAARTGQRVSSQRQDQI